MMITRPWLSLVLTATILLTSLNAAWSSEPTDTVQGAIQRVFDTSSVEKIKTAPAAERQAQIRQVAESLFDFRDMARRSLGPRFEELGAADQDEFVQLFTNLIAASYMSKVEAYAGEPIQYLDETVNGTDARVASRLVTTKGSQVNVDYRLHRADNRWTVYDVVIDGVSLVENYRMQFSRLIQRTSFAELLKTLRAKAGS